VENHLTKKTVKTKRSSIPGVPDCQEECLYDYIFNKVKFGVFILDVPNEKIIYKNPFFNDIAQKQERQILEKVISLIKSEEFTTGEQRDISIHISSQSFDLGISGYHINDDYLIIFLKDISSKKISQERNNLDRLYRDFSTTLGTVAHEVGNPLSSIGTSLQIVLANIGKWEENKTKDYLGKTINEIQRVSEFLKNMRNFTWNENLDIKEADLKTVVSKVIENNELFIKSHKVTVKTDISDNLKVMIDEGAFLQVLLNLINNSVNILKGQKSARIKISTETFNQKFVKLIYKNNGKPIEEENLEKIFTLFYSTNERGRGMGLAISLKLMTLMGGTIKAVAPEDGIGAEFNLFIPLIPA
jgi:signal transduction histidine kinase